MKNLAYWKGRKIDAYNLWKQTGNIEDLKAWTFAIAKVEDLEFRLFNRQKAE